MPDVRKRRRLRHRSAIRRHGSCFLPDDLLVNGPPSGLSPRRAGRGAEPLEREPLPIPLSRVWIVPLATVARASRCAHRRHPERRERPWPCWGNRSVPTAASAAGSGSRGPAADVTRVRGVESAAANRGGLCAKGAQLGPTITHRRPPSPSRRSASTATTTSAPSAWDTALRLPARVLHQHPAHATAPRRSPSTAAASSTPRAVYLAGKLFKGCLGCNNTDSNSRLCMAAAVAGYRTSLGSDGPPELLRRHRSRRCGPHHRQQHGRGASGHLRPPPRHQARPTRDRRSSSSIRGARRPRPSPTCTSPSRPAATSPCSTPSAGCCLSATPSTVGFVARATRAASPSIADFLCGAGHGRVVPVSRRRAKSDRSHGRG